MTNIDLFMKVFLLIYLMVFVLILNIFSVAAFKNKYGLNPYVIQKEDEIMYLFQVYRKLTFLSLLTTVAVYAFVPQFYRFLVPIEYLDILPLRFLGLALLVGSLVLVRVSQQQLRDSWRIGMDRSGAKTDLITTGIFSHSRNPIALGMTLNAFGFLLVIPNVITFTVANLTYLIFSIRIRLEEDHLHAMHGEIYDQYRKRTRRWI